MKKILAIISILIFILLTAHFSISATYLPRAGNAQRYSSGGQVLVSSGAQIWVYQAGTTTLATLYSTSTGSAQTNPVIADRYGNYLYYAANGRYDETIVGPAGTSPVNIYSVGIGVGSSSSVWVDTVDYATFSEAVSVAAVLNRGVLTSTTVTISTGMTVTVPVSVVAGGRIVLSSSPTVTFSEFNANSRKVFYSSGTGTVKFSRDGGVEPNPYWWGAKGDNATDSLSAIQAAIDSVSSDSTPTTSFAVWGGGVGARGMNAAKISLPHGRYKIGGALSVPTGVMIEGNNSLVTQTTTSANMIEFRWTTGYGYYGTFMNGLQNITLNCAGKGEIGLLMNKVNWSNVSNVIVTGCSTGIVLQEVQYTTFTQINSYDNSVDGIVLTYSPDQVTLFPIDNVFINVNASLNDRYGLVLHASNHNYFYKTDLSRNTVADMVIGGTRWGTPAGYATSNNAFYDTKVEHNRDDVPTSGYAIIIDGASGTTFTNLSVSRQLLGTLYDPYFKWLYNNGFNTVINNPYDFNLAVGGTALLENPSVPGDYSIFRAIAFNGLLVNYGAHWQQDYIHTAATDSTDANAAASSRYAYTYATQGGMASHNYTARGLAGTGDVAFSGRVVGDVADRFYIAGDGTINWGDGTGATDTTLYRTFGGGGIRTGGDLTVDGLSAAASHRSTLFTPAVKNLYMTLQSGLFEIPGTILYMLTSTISNTSADSRGIYINPTYNQTSGSGTNSILYIAPTYSAVSTGIQYAIRVQEASASAPAFSVNRTGFVSAVTGTSVASAATITLTGKVTPITGSAAIVTINVPYTGFQGEVELIPVDGAFTTTNAGNIAIASTAVIGRTLRMTYVPATSKWYPSY